MGIEGWVGNWAYWVGDWWETGEEMNVGLLNVWNPIVKTL